MADARGFFWYYPNSGKPNAPVFTHGEVMPVWLGAGFVEDSTDERSPEFEGDVVPRLQLVDFTGEKKLSIVSGTFLGGLYYVHNNGSSTSPAFRTTTREDAQVPTHSGGLMWCNYLAPFLYDWSGSGRLDLVMGDGSYSANSIYLFTNMGNNDHPKFTEAKQVKLIPGMGREDLTPQVVDWNNDGKPDIIAGERIGYINLYLNQAASSNDAPVFDKDHPQHIMFGSSDKTGTLTTVCAADINNDNLFDLIVSSTDGTIMYSLNVGTPGAPKFGPLTPFKGVNPFPKIIKPRTWVYDRYRPDGAAYELLECVNAQTEKGFTPPPDTTLKGAMKFSVIDPHNVYFTSLYVPSDAKRYIRYASKITLQAEKRYTLSFLSRTDGDVSELTYHLEGLQTISGKELRWTQYSGSSLNTGSSWSRANDQVRIPSVIPGNSAKTPETGSFVFWLTFKGSGTLYLDDISLKLAE